jgi:hypothetical protein
MSYILHAVGPRYPQVYGSEETAITEKTQILRQPRFSSSLKSTQIYLQWSKASLSIRNLKMHGVDYIIITKMSVAHIATEHQKFYLISGFLFLILSMIDSVFP